MAAVVLGSAAPLDDVASRLVERSPSVVAEGQHGGIEIDLRQGGWSRFGGCKLAVVGLGVHGKARAA